VPSGPTMFRARVSQWTVKARRVPAEIIGTLLLENAKAYLVRYNGRQIWIPKDGTEVLESVALADDQGPSMIQPLDGFTAPSPGWAAMTPGGLSVEGVVLDHELKKRGLSALPTFPFPSLPEVPRPNTKTRAWRHQLEAYQVCWHHRGSGLWMDMGTGKSFVICALCSTLPNIKRVLIICPKAVVGVWRGQFALHAGREFLIEPLIKGTVEQKVAQAKAALALGERTGTPVVLVINYESAWRPPFGPTRSEKTRRVIEEGFAMRAQFDLVVADEIHKAKAPTGRASKFLDRLAGVVERRIGLSGTPIAHSFLDLFAQYRFVDKRVFGPSFITYKNRYAEFGGFEGHEVKGIRPESAPELARKIYSIAYRATEDVIELPPQQDITRTFTLSPKAARIYKDLETEFYTEVEAGEVTAANALVKLLRLQQVTSGFVTVDNAAPRTGQHQLEFQHEVDDGKREQLREILDNLAPDEKVVVFCTFLHDLKVVRDLCENPGPDGIKRVYGEVSGNRKDLTEDSKFPPHIDVLGVQIKSGGVGIDLTAARIGIYYSVGFSLSDYEQSRKRVRRPGQTRPVIYYHLVAEKTVDRKVYQALKDKSDVVRFILDHRGILPELIVA
jgi:SNF2 family DNA or RNA helicase